VIALTAHTGDELAIADIDLDLCRNYKETLFQFERYRRPDAYGVITERRGPLVPPPPDHPELLDDADDTDEDIP
jgi:hypothetical protein